MLRVSSRSSTLGFLFFFFCCFFGPDNLVTAIPNAAAPRCCAREFRYKLSALFRLREIAAGLVCVTWKVVYLTGNFRAG